MKGKYILFLICSLFLCEVSAQTLEQARTLFTKGEYEQAKPVFKKYTKSQPSNGNYNYWYGVCCLKTGEAEEAVKPLEIAVKKRITGGQLYLGQAYNETYRFEDAVNCFEEYIADLSKRKKPTEEAEKLLEKSKSDLRMLKGVEEVCIIDSFVVDKATFLNAYKISEESGKLFTFNEFFKTEGDHPGTVYETEIGNKIYYSEKGEKGNLDIFSKNKLLNEWSDGRPLPGSINASGNANYPFVLSDGVTVYYASDGEDWVAMIFLSLATTRIPTLILFRKMWVCRSTRRTTIICTSSMNTTTSDGLLPTVSNRKERYVFMYSSLTLPNRLIIMKQWSSKRSFVWHRFIR